MDQHPQQIISFLKGDGQRKPASNLHIRANSVLSTSLFISLLFFTNQIAYGQLSGSSLIGSKPNALPAAVPFLTIAPDARSSGMGDAGAASDPDIHSQHWNSAKYAFVEGSSGVALTYTPWITNLIPDVSHIYLAGYFKINDRNTISGSWRYFLPGTTSFVSGPLTGVSFRPREFAVDAGYSRKFTDHFSGGMVLRYIRSVLGYEQTPAGGMETQPGTSLAGDLGLYYQDEFLIGERNAMWAAGLNISNVGAPISYSKDAEKVPIPTNLKMGGRFTYCFNEKNSISFQADLNKLMVPTPALYDLDSTTGDAILVRGMEPPGSVILGMFQSFYDAPGVVRSDGTYSVGQEELHEITFGLGVEYWYRKRLAVRAGYFSEHPSKGIRNYFTTGLGARYRFLTFDISYLLPVQGQNSILANTFRLTLLADFGQASD